MKRLKLSNSRRTVKLNDADYAIQSKYSWHVCIRRKQEKLNGWHHDKGTVCRFAGGANRHRVYLARTIMGVTDPAIKVAYLDASPLNCQRSNLILTDSQGLGRLRRKQKNKSTSRYKGVFYRKDARKWSAKVWVDHKPINLGVFTSQKAAALAYNEKAAELFGSTARLNKI